MTDIAHTKFHDTEIAKAEDFIYTAASFITMMSAIMDGLSYDVINSFVVAGLSVDQAATPSMSVRIRPGMAFSKAESKFLHLGSDLAVSVSPADADLDRIDTVEIRQASTDIGLDSRAFKDPISGGVSYANVYTRTKVSIEARCIAGTPGAGIAPAVESGWMKLSEVDVPAETTEIITALIHNVSSEADGVANDAWTEEEDTTFHLGSVSYIKDMVHDHLADDITSSNTVHGIRQGSGNGLDADKLDGMQPAAAATASTIAQRDANGRTQFAEPAVAADVAVLKTVTDHAALTAPHSATAAATADRLVIRDASGRAKFADPSDNADVATKGYVAGLVGAKVVTNTVNLGDITSDYVLPALNVGEICFLRLYGHNSKGSYLAASLPASGTYRLISNIYESNGICFHSEHLSPNAASDSNSLILGIATANYDFAAEIIYIRVS